MGKRILAGLLSVLLTVALLPKAALAADEIAVDLSSGYILITGVGPAFEVRQNGTLVRAGTLSNTSVRITGTYPAAAGSNNVPINVSVSNTSEATPLKITLSNVTIMGPNSWGIENNALMLDNASKPHVLLTLEGTNTLKLNDRHAAVHVPEDAFLTIQGNGTLDAAGGSSGTIGGAGIGGNGGSSGGNSGTITINGGTVNATSRGNGAAIGGGGAGQGGTGGSGGTITINGGTVTAAGGGLGAGIGGGGASSIDLNGRGTGGSGGVIKINGGTVSAKNGYSIAGSYDANLYGAAIGGGAGAGPNNTTSRASGSVNLSGYAQYEWAHTDSDTEPTAFEPAPYLNGQQNAPGWTKIRPTIAPSFTTHPQSQTVTAGETATFTAAATGTAPITYQWWLSTDGGSSWGQIPGATDTSYTTPAVTTSMSGQQYQCVATNRVSGVPSNAATLTVTAAAAPTVDVSPARSFVQGNAPALRLTVGAGITGFNASNNLDVVSVRGTDLTDGVEYTSSNGSILIDFDRNWLNLLTPGVYPVDILLKGGAYAGMHVYTSFEVLATGGFESDVPKTGDNTPIALLCGLLLLCGAGLIIRKNEQ